MEAVVSKGAAGAEMAAGVAKEVTEAGLGSVEGSAAAMVVVVMAVARVVAAKVVAYLAVARWWR